MPFVSRHLMTTRKLRGDSGLSLSGAATSEVVRTGAVNRGAARRAAGFGRRAQGFANGMAGDVRQIAASSGTTSTRKKSRGGLGGFFRGIGRGIKGIAKVAGPAALAYFTGGGSLALSGLAGAAGRVGKIARAVQTAGKFLPRGTPGIAGPTGYEPGDEFEPGPDYQDEYLDPEQYEPFEPAPVLEEPGRGGAVNSGGFGGPVEIRWHSTAPLMPLEIFEFIVKHNLAPTPEAVVLIAESVGAGVTGAEGNRIAFPDGNEFKLVWHMIEQDDTTTWGWDLVR